MRVSTNLSDKVFNIINYTIMIIVAFLTLYPFWYVVIVSFSTIDHVITSNFIFFPNGIHLDAYRQVFRNNLVPTAYRNTLIVVSLGTALSMLLTILGAYVLSLRKLPGRQFLTLFVVFTMLFGGGLVPYYLVVNSLGFINTLWSLIIPGCVSTYNMILMLNAFRSVPDSIFEAAELDGTSITGYLLRILLPLSIPTLATIVLFYVVGHWNSYFYALIFIREQKLLPMQAILRQILVTSEFNTMMYDDATQKLPPETLKNAMIVITVMPTIMVYPFLQKYFVKGIMVGSLKG